MNPAFLLIFGVLAQEPRPPVVTPLERVDWPWIQRPKMIWPPSLGASCPTASTAWTSRWSLLDAHPANADERFQIHAADAPSALPALLLPDLSELTRPWIMPVFCP